MDKFKFSDDTVSGGDWYTFFSESENKKIPASVLVLNADTPTNQLVGPLNKLDRIVVTSNNFNDGRMFSLGRKLRSLGYSGELTVVGDVLPDQYTSLRFCGFDNALRVDNLTEHQTIDLDRALSLAGVEYSRASNPQFPGLQILGGIQ